MSNKVIVVGGGLSGLCCARTLNQKGIEVTLLESSTEVGGRVATDEVDGFLLDRGFQVLLTAYPEARKVLDYESLELRAYEPGALVRIDTRFDIIGDPWRRPSRLIATALSKVGSLSDKLKIQTLRQASREGSLDDIFDRPDTTTIDSLKDYGFSDQMIDRFFRPFLGGVFLDPTLETSSRMLHFVFRMFSDGLAAVPANGMRMIPRQIAAQLPEDAIRTSTKVTSIAADSVTTSDGELLQADAVVMATDQQTAMQLAERDGTPRAWRRVRCLYFSADKAPVEDRMLVLNGNGRGPINNLSVPSRISESYAPAGKHLVSASVLDDSVADDALEGQVRSQLQEWFGNAPQDWKHLRTYDIPHALPNQTPPAFDPTWQSPKLENGAYVCGDYRAQGSIQGAMVSGRKAAEAVIADLS